MFREAHRCYTLPKGDLEKVVTGFPHLSQLIEDKLTTGCSLFSYAGDASGQSLTSAAELNKINNLCD